MFSNEAGEPLKTFKKAWQVTVLKAHGVDPRWRKDSYKDLAAECQHQHLTFQSDQDFGATAERCPIQVLTSDRPVQHVPKQAERSVDRGRSELARVQDLAPLVPAILAALHPSAAGERTS